MPQSYTGPLPYLDEQDERLSNSEHIQSGLIGTKRVTPFDSSGNELIVPSLATAVVSGTTTVTTAGTAVRITSTPTTIKGIWLNADLIVGIAVTVGDSSVVGNAAGMRGVVLIPGNQPIFLAINDLSLLWVDAQANGGRLSYLYVT